MTDTISVYIAARTEDQARAAAIRDALRPYGVRCTARWLDLIDVPRSSPDGARVCLEDIERADVFLLLNPAEAHRTGTGGRHTEAGYALGQGKPLLVYGAPENVFHSLARVQVVDGGIGMHALAVLVKLASQHGTPLPDDGWSLPPAPPTSNGSTPATAAERRAHVALDLRRIGAAFINDNGPVGLWNTATVGELLLEAAQLIDGKTLQQAATEAEAAL